MPRGSRAALPHAALSPVSLACRCLVLASNGRKQVDSKEHDWGAGTLIHRGDLVAHMAPNSGFISVLNRPASRPFPALVSPPPLLAFPPSVHLTPAAPHPVHTLSDPPPSGTPPPGPYSRLWPSFVPAEAFSSCTVARSNPTGRDVVAAALALLPPTPLSPFPFLEPVPSSQQPLGACQC